MLATTLPPVFQAPVAAPNATANAVFSSHASPGGAGPDSFARLLDAADARRQAEAAPPAAAEKQPANPAPKPAARPAQGTKPANAQSTAPSTAQGTAGRTPADGERPAGSATTEDTAAADGEPEDTAATDPTLGADAAALLAGLAALPRAVAAAAAAAAPAGAGAGTAHGPNLAAAGLLTDTASDTARSTAAWHGTDAAQDALRAHTAANVATRGTPGAEAAAAPPFAKLMAGVRAADDAAAAETSSQQLQDSVALAPQARSAAADTGTLPGMLPLPTAGPGSLHSAPTAAAAHTRLPATPGSPEFATQLGAQLTTFVREGVQHARLELHPVELGPVTVQIQLDGGNAQVHLSAEHAFTRQALEEALPALAGSLREAGLTLSGGGVFEQPRQPQPDSGQAPGGRGERGGRGNADSDTGATTAAATATRRRGVVDLVA